MNTLREFLETINKKDCPQECEFKYKEIVEKEIEIAKVPPPKEISSILISRDPTTNWIEKGYREAMKTSGNERREMLFDAIPKELIGQIEVFKGREEKNLCKSFIYKKAYWTHLHKCFTDAKNKFSCANSTRCADKWLKEELRIAMANNDIKFIITLGNDVHEWVEGWKSINGIKIETIKLPHPSGQNNRFWHRNEKYKNKTKEMDEEIDKLIELIKEKS